MNEYSRIVRHVLKNGVQKESRTEVNTVAVAGMMFTHDMSEGFPLLTTKYVPLRLVASELECFIKGITDKRWLQDRKNYIWNQWCNPQKVPYGHDDETQQQMTQERDLGPIYGWQWRNFGKKYHGYDTPPSGTGVDQLQKLVHTLKSKPHCRRMIVTAWNPQDLQQMALPPCHYAFQVTVTDGKLNLLWNQRSVDVALGLPFDIASYGLLLHLLAQETGLEEGRLVGFLADTHIYENHISGLREQITREPYQLPTVETAKFSSIFEWEHTDTRAIEYIHHPRIKYDIAV